MQTAPKHGKIQLFQTVNRLRSKQKTARNPNRCTPVFVMSPALLPKPNDFKPEERKFYQPNIPKMACNPDRIDRSTIEKKTAVSAARMKTMIVVSNTSRRVGQTTLETSERTCWINWIGFVIAMLAPVFELIRCRYALG